MQSKRNEIKEKTYITFGSIKIDIHGKESNVARL